MGKRLMFNELPTLVSLEGLTVNGGKFVQGEGLIGDSGIVMHIPGTFRFDTNLEIAETINGDWVLVMTQFLMRGPELWEMEEAFSRIGFRNPEAQEQLEALCEALITRGLARWVEES